MEKFKKWRTMPFYLVDVCWDGFRWIDNGLRCHSWCIVTM